MKKTLTINLNSIVYHIDEDAYQQLHDYLEAVRGSLSLSDDIDEIMLDIEARIAELFNEFMEQKRLSVVTVEMVKGVMQRMGEPKDYVMGTTIEDEQSKPFARKRYYRDIDNGMLGGVAAGLAAFLGWDVVWIRLIFTLLILLGYGWPLLFYVLMWIVASPARTMSQKLEMRGEPVTIDTIHEGFTEMAAKTPSWSRKLARIVGVILKVCFFAVVGFLGMIALVVIGLLLFVFIAISLGMIGEGIGAMSLLPEILWDMPTLWAMLQPWQVTLCQVSIVLLCVCPLVIVIAGVLSLLAKRCWTSKKFNMAFVIVWLLALGAIVFTVISSVTLRQQMVDMALQLDDWDEDRVLSSMAYEVVDMPAFEAIQANGAVNMLLQGGEENNVSVRPAVFKSNMHVDNGVLYINNSQRQEVELVITTPNLSFIALAGACQVKNRDTLLLPSLRMVTNGAADMDLTLCVDELSIDAQGAANIDLEGNAKHALFQLQGAVDLEADELAVNNMQLKVDGAADVEVWAKDSLEINADGFSNIQYKGNPVTTIPQKSWATKIRQDNY